MKKSILYLCLLTVVLTSAINASAQYSNATLNGPWFLHYNPISPFNDSSLYVVFDGVGTITDISGFCTSISGSYAVTAGGAITATLNCDTDVIPFTGQLTSTSGGSVSLMGENFVLTKVSNPAALTDSLIGILYTENCGQKNVKMFLNSSGQVTSCEGLAATVTGGIYTEQGIFIGHFRSGEVDGWNQFSIMGYYASDSLKGLVGLDNTGCGNNFAKLERKSTIVSVNEVSKTSVLKIYPNPASDLVTLNLENANIADVILNIYNVYGELIRSENLQKNQHQINIADLSNGIYIVEIKSKDCIENQKLIIQR